MFSSPESIQQHLDLEADRLRGFGIAGNHLYCPYVYIGVCLQQVAGFDCLILLIYDLLKSILIETNFFVVRLLSLPSLVTSRVRD